MATKPIFCLVCLMFLFVGCDSDIKHIAFTNRDYKDTSEPLGQSSLSRQKAIKLGGVDFNIREDIVYATSDEFNRVFRIPSAIITNEGSILLSCESRSEMADKGEIEILVARLERRKKNWHIRKVIAHNAKSYGRSMNPIFVIDRFGVHGRKGRIYLFAAHMKKPDYGVNQTTEDADFVYKYSDDDGLSWSSETSLKHLWDTTKYQAIYPSACNGIQTSDGTLLVPTMITKDNKWRSGMLQKRPDKDWMFSSPTIYDGDNESSVYINSSLKIQYTA